MLIENYQRSPSGPKLAPSTEADVHDLSARAFPAGDATVTEIRRRDIIAIRDSIAAIAGHGAAHGFIRAASALFTWARKAEWIEHNPVTEWRAGPRAWPLPAWTIDRRALAMERLPEHLRRVVVLAL